MKIDKLLIFQILIHIISVTFLYIYFFRSGKKCKISNKVKESKKINPTCFKLQCSKAATENECDKYARCTWSSAGCKAKEDQCDELQPKNKSMDRFKCKKASHCKLESDNCYWNNELLQSGPMPKIIDETTGLNKYCSKRKGTFNMKNLNEFVEDEYFQNCVTNSENTRERCEQNAKMKLECNSLEGHTFDETISACKSLQFKASKLKEKKIAPHQHTSEQLKGTSVFPKNAYMSDLFIMREEPILKYYLSTFIISVIILTNIGFARWMMSR